MSDTDQSPPEAIPVTEDDQAPPEEKKPRARRRKKPEPREEIEPVGSAVDRVLEGAQQGEKAKLPDPHWFESIALTEDKDGPKMRLGRSHRFRQMQMRFDEKPPQDVIDTLSDNGWRWKQQEKVWALSLERDAEWRGHADAQRLFKDIGNTLREANGLDPVGQAMG